MGPDGAWLRTGRAKRAPCASHVQAMRNQAPSGTTVSVFHDLRLVLHVGNTFPRFVTVVEACGDPHIQYMIDASPVHGDFIFDTGGGIERSKPLKRVANVQNKPKIMKTRHCGARWCLVAHCLHMGRTRCPLSTSRAQPGTIWPHLVGCL